MEMNKPDKLNERQDRLDKLREQIWITRISRIKAESRYISKENFYQGLNIYYSCITIIFSIISLIKPSEILNLITVAMTISVFIVILYLNGQKYLTYAKEYRNNYIKIHELEAKLNYISANDTEEIEKIELAYCDLLDTSNNHISYDYYCAIKDNKNRYNIRWKNIRGKYWKAMSWRLLIKIITIILPIIFIILIKILCEVL